MPSKLPQSVLDATSATPKVCRRGTHRARPPGETVAAMEPFFTEIGITRVANVTGMDNIGIPTVMVVRPNARSLSVSQGKGADLDSAKASGIMEAAEQWHAERIDLPLRLASYAEIARTSAVIDPATLPAFVKPFDPQARLLWIAGQDLRSGDSWWVPFELANLDLRLPLPEGSGYFLAGSNGLASGNNLLEAVAHGLWEVVERDALTLFYLLSAPEQWQRRLDLHSVGDQLCRELLQRYANAEVDVAVWDTTSDLGMPCFLCSVLDRELNPFRPVGLARGSGCHADPAVALARALTEAAQSRLTRIVGSRDDIQRRDFDRLRTEEDHQRHRAQMATPARPPRRFEQVPGASHDTFEQDLVWAQERLRAGGIERVLVVDLTRPDFPVRVARVIVPGLEGFADLPGYQPGRRARARAEAVR
jgi:YcaO-like protein with predicted kinase domain